MDIAWHCILVKEHWLYNFTACQSVNLVLNDHQRFLQHNTVINSRQSSLSSFTTTRETRAGAESYFLAKGELVDIPPIC